MMSETSRRDEDIREGEVSIYTFIRGLGWSIVVLLATSYVFLLLAGFHSVFALLPA